MQTDKLVDSTTGATGGEDGWINCEASPGMRAGGDSCSPPAVECTGGDTADASGEEEERFKKRKKSTSESMKF